MGYFNNGTKFWKISVGCIIFHKLARCQNNFKFKLQFHQKFLKLQGPRGYARPFFIINPVNIFRIFDTLSTHPIRSPQPSTATWPSSEACYWHFKLQQISSRLEKRGELSRGREENGGLSSSKSNPTPTFLFGEISFRCPIRISRISDISNLRRYLSQVEIVPNTLLTKFYFCEVNDMIHFGLDMLKGGEG